MDRSLIRSIEYPGHQVFLAPEVLSDEDRRQFDEESDAIIATQGEPRNEDGSRCLLAGGDGDSTGKSPNIDIPAPGDGSWLRLDLRTGMTLARAGRLKRPT
ncbi:MAG TPA: hypothetical protein VIH90_05540 [Candidatus Saccharimonadales bacterium]